MKNQKTRAKKAEKKRAQRKDYEKKHNIYHNNVPASQKRKGINSDPVLHAGDGILPKSKKYTPSKKEVVRQKKALGNIIKTVTAK